MIDANDKQTQSLALDEQPAKRGRPATGKALSNADRQRAYRERQKAQRNEKPCDDPYGKKVIESLEMALREEMDKTAAAKARIRELEAQLAQRNETPMKERPKEKLHGWVVQLKSMHMKHWKTITKRPWPTEEIALKRIEELKADHRTNEDMEYRAKKV
ncbi:hypothetical protein D9M68_625620 [compost metagenome]